MKDTSKRLKIQIPKDIYRLLREIAQAAERNHMRIYLVGGFVRDLILGKLNFDIDIVTEGEAIKFARILTKQLKATLKLYPRFKTARLNLKDGLKLDLASARTEVYTQPAALPVVKLSSLQDDLYRRDFTINALALGLNQNNFAQLIDFFNAEQDLKQKKIKVLHDLSFMDDPTRILRAVRFEQRFDFKIDKYTERLIHAAVDLKMLERLSKSRLANELVLLLSEPHPVKVINRMNQLCKLKFIHPKIRFNQNTAKSFKAAQAMLHECSRLTIKPEHWIVYFLILIDGLKLEDCRVMLKHFSFKKKAAECVVASKVKAKGIAKKISGVKNIQPSQAYRILKPLPIEVIIFLLAKSKHRKTKELYAQFLMKYDNIKLKITGDDLKRLQLPAGPVFKKVLENTLYAKIDGRITSKQEELDFVERLLCV